MCDEMEISPLLDMAGIVDVPSLQAESAVALMNMAKDQAVVPLCTPRAFQEFNKLLQSDQTDVAYPTARMLHFLAQCPAATPYFAEEVLLSTIPPRCGRRPQMHWCKSSWHRF